jgi:hypothetical protein
MRIKRDPRQKIWKNIGYLIFYLLTKLDNFVLENNFQFFSIWEIANLAKSSKSRKSVKGTKLTIPY